jgi:hypothetical protein
MTAAAHDFNAAPPSGPIQLYRTVRIGWQHTIDGDGDNASVVLTLDADGNPVPTEYRIPSHLTTRQLVDGTKDLSEERVAAMASGGLAGVLELADVVLGNGIVEAVAADPTVPTPTFMRFLETILAELDIADMLGSDGSPN